VKAARTRSGFPRVVVGFAAESENLLENARDKLDRKGVDMLVANDISATDAGFGTDTNRVTVLAPDGTADQLALQSKADVADEIVKRIAAVLS
ncbi:MAG: phosphopantothenoylcysteine decarboxylase, partial [Chloroflexota bacterium]